MPGASNFVQRAVPNALDNEADFLKRQRLVRYKKSCEFLESWMRKSLTSQEVVSGQTISLG